MPESTSSAQHLLKTWPEYFRHIVDHSKSYELRRDDRKFEVGDMLTLEEWCPDREDYTGRVVRRRITHILRYHSGLARGFCILSLGEE